VTTRATLVRDAELVLLFGSWQQDNVGPDRARDAVMLHFLFPEGHATADRNGSLCQAARSAISAAQSTRFTGPAMLRFYADVSSFILDESGDVEVLLGRAATGTRVEERRALARAAGSARALDLDTVERVLAGMEAGAVMLAPFDYGSHQTYLRATRDVDHFHLDHFDRQRQNLTVNHQEVPGYFPAPDGDPAGRRGRPLRFTCSGDAGALAADLKVSCRGHRFESRRRCYADGKRWGVRRCFLAPSSRRTRLIVLALTPCSSAKSARQLIVSGVGGWSAGTATCTACAPG